MRYASVVMGLFVVTSCLSAGVYDPDEPSVFRFANGVVQPLDFATGNSGEFAVRFSTIANRLDDNPNRKNEDRAVVLRRIAAFKVDGATPLQLAKHSADLILSGKAEKALSILQPLSRGRTASYVILMNLAHAYAMTGDWNAALRTHDLALDYDPGKELTKLSPEQRTWLLTVEKKYYKAWLIWNLNNPKPNPETQQPLPLFGSDKPPADAIAVVQQLLLWHPGDSNLYWLLAELYVADGKPRLAEVIFNQCANSRQYSNRKVLMAHRAAVIEAVAKLPPESKTEDILIPPTPVTPLQPKEEGDGENGLPPIRNILLAVVIFGPLCILLVIFQVLSIRKRLRKTSS